jgi:hypothetical protein
MGEEEGPQGRGPDQGKVGGHDQDVGVRVVAKQVSGGQNGVGRAFRLSLVDEADAEEQRFLHDRFALMADDDGRFDGPEAQDGLTDQPEHGPAEQGMKDLIGLGSKAATLPGGQDEG